jgi:hypothetical protein
MTALFEDELEVFHTEEETAQQYFFSYLGVRSLVATNAEVLRIMNATPLFWITTHHAMLLAAFVALGRIFDQDRRSLHNIDKLMRTVSADLAMFSRPALELRKQLTGAISRQEAKEYVSTAYELTAQDVRDIRKKVASWRKIYEARYRGIRHGVFAHKGLSKTGTNALMKLTNVEEMKAMFGFLHKLHDALWELYKNGRKPDLRTRNFVMPPAEAPAGMTMTPGRAHRAGSPKGSASDATAEA